jgi:hypothetical protein
MNTYISQLTTTTVTPGICSTWEMIGVMSDSRLKPNSNRHYLNFETKYDLSVAYGKKYIKEPYLDYIRFGKLVKRYSLEEFISMMNLWGGGDSTYIDENGEFLFSDCIKYSQLPSRIYANIEEYIKAFSTIGDVTDVNSLYAYTNYKFSNIKSTRNAIGCFDDVRCIVNYCHDKGHRWMYDPNTQMCYYSADSIVVPSDDKMFFAN